MHCETFQPDPGRANQSVSIYAGHFNWYSVVPEDHEYACLTTFRHPVERVVSCLFYRFPERTRNISLASMGTDAFKSLLLNTDHDNNVSCNNEGLFLLTRTASTPKLNALVNKVEEANLVVKEAIKNLRKCVILISGSGDHEGPGLRAWNAQVLDHWFPWLGEVGWHNANPHPVLPAHLASVVLELNWPELQLYYAALQQFRDQQRILGGEAPMRSRPH